MTRRRQLLAALAVGAAFGAGCGSEGRHDNGGAGGTTTIGTGGAPTGGTTGGSSGSGGSIAGGGTGGPRGTGGNGSPTSSGGTGGPTGSPTEPVIPAVDGSCPTFVAGTSTITASGLSGISVQVGAKQQGTGALVFYWHGTGSTANEVNLLIPASVRQEILDQGGIIVSPQSSLGTGGDCSGTGTFSKDDFKVADLIAACAVRDWAIDPHRIYTTGCSAGGLQAGCMGALRSSYIAAVAPNSGGEVAQQAIQDPTRTPSVMTMHGGSSDKVVVSFATTSATYDMQMKSAGSFVIDCDHGGGHCQAPGALYTAAWEFMKAHPFGVSPEPFMSMLPNDFPSYCTIY